MKVYQIGSQYLPPLTLKWDGAFHERKKKIQTTPDTLIWTCICSCFSSDLFLMPSATVWKYVLMNPFGERDIELKLKWSPRLQAERKNNRGELPSVPSPQPQDLHNTSKKKNSCFGIQEKERSVDGIVWSSDYSWIHMDTSTHWAGTYPAMWMARCTYLCVFVFFFFNHPFESHL